MANANVFFFTLLIVVILLRYIDFHLKHSHGRLFQYVDAHLNDYSQVDLNLSQ